MHRAAQGRHYSTAPESNQWQSRAVIIQGGISCYRLFLPYIKKTTADLFMVGYQQAHSSLPPRLDAGGRAPRGSCQRPAEQEGAAAACAAASSAGIPQLVLREGKAVPVLARSMASQGLLCSSAIFQPSPQRAVSKAKCKPYLLPGCFHKISGWKK